MSRDLDRLVAEQVMGLIACNAWTEDNLGSAGGPVLRGNCRHERCYPTQEIEMLFGMLGGPPPYSTDLRKAWEVVEWLKSCEIEQVGIYWLGNKRVWTCAVEWPLEADEGVRVQAETAAEAICLVALQVIHSRTERSQRMEGKR